MFVPKLPSHTQIGRNLWLYLIQWLQLSWKKFMALALPVFLFLWKAYSRMERQVMEFQKFPMVRKFGVSSEQMWCWGQAWNRCGILRTVLRWILNKIPPNCNVIWRARLEPAHSTLFWRGVNWWRWPLTFVLLVLYLSHLVSHETRIPEVEGKAGKWQKSH